MSDETPTTDDATPAPNAGEVQDATQNQAHKSDQAFTPITSQEALDAIIAKRVERERRKYADYDTLAAKISTLETDLAAAAAKVQDYEREAAHTSLVREVAKETGVPADLLRGSTRDEMTAHGKALAEYLTARSATPVIPSLGAAPETKQSTEQAFVKMLFGN
jgi:chromosomal replication initiation ATPase DnaA